MKAQQQELDLCRRAMRRQTAAERLIALLQRDGSQSTYQIQAHLGIRDVCGPISRANSLLADQGLHIERLITIDRVAIYCIGPNRASPAWRDL